MQVKKVVSPRSDSSSRHSKTRTNTNASLELVRHERQLSLEQSQTSRVIADNPSSDYKSSPQMQAQDKGEEKEDDRSKDNSIDGESLVFIRTCIHLRTICTIVLHSMTSLPDFILR